MSLLLVPHLSLLPMPHLSLLLVPHLCFFCSLAWRLYPVERVGTETLFKSFQWALAPLDKGAVFRRFNRT